MKGEALIRLSGGVWGNKVMPPRDEEAQQAQTTLICPCAPTQTFALVIHPLVQLQPGGETFAVLVLEPKEPGFPQPDGLDDLKHRR